MVRTVEELVDYYAELADKYPIISLEDGVAEKTGKAGNCLPRSLVTDSAGW